VSKAQVDIPVFNDKGEIRPKFLRRLNSAVEAGDGKEARALTAGLHEADLADVIEQLPAESRREFVTLLGRQLDFGALPELEETVRDEIIEHLPNATLARAVRELESDDAVYLLEDLDEQEREEVLSRIPKFERVALERSLEYPEDSAGRMMQTDFIAVPPFWSVGQVIDYLRSSEDLPDDFYEILVIDPAGHLTGTVPLSRIMRTRRPAIVANIMYTDPPVIPVDRDQEDVAYDFKRYNLLSAGVVDNDQRIVGVITIDDIIDVVEEEAAEDIQRLGGVGDETVFDTLWSTIKGRFVWLLVNLGTAVLASLAIGMFDAEIDKMVALAILMPIVASMGGNAGTQTMTVAVRALATRDLGPLNAMRVITRETVVGLMNGVLFAGVTGAVAYVWFGDLMLGAVIGAAMVVNLMVAGLAGILVPLGLDRLKLDPAISSTVFVTTVTDVVGFVAFLGLAAIWLL